MNPLHIRPYEASTQSANTLGRGITCFVLGQTWSANIKGVFSPFKVNVVLNYLLQKSPKL